MLKFKYLILSKYYIASFVISVFLFISKYYIPAMNDAPTLEILSLYLSFKVFIPLMLKRLSSLIFLAKNKSRYFISPNYYVAFYEIY